MGNEFKGQAGHSAEHFGDLRDHWWNSDFLQLMAKRWKLDAIQNVLDVGCGVGHWGMLLAPFMSENVRVTGIDREPRWVTQASERAGARGFDGRFSYRQGDAERLPFPDNSFDLTTCQTVLIHVSDSAAAIAEMLRVTKPGGLVAVAEPNNLTESLLLDSISNQASIDEIVDLVRFQLVCERGKVELGEGDNSLGDRVPGLFVAQGLVEVEVYVNDKATAVFPPYSASVPSPRMRVTVWHGVSGTGTRPTLGGSTLLAAAPKATSWSTSPVQLPLAKGSSTAWMTPPITASLGEGFTSWLVERRPIKRKSPAELSAGR